MRRPAPMHPPQASTRARERKETALSASAVWGAVGGILGILGIIGVLARISFQLGSLVTEFRAYVKLNDLVVSKIEDRVGLIEQRRQGWPR
jgi:hypothetical protein